jgi:hypothetical protein
MTRIRSLSIFALISLVVLSSLAFTINPVHSETYQIVNVMVAYDEEWASTSWWVYGYHYPYNLCFMFLDQVSDRFYTAFGIKFSVVCYTYWDSNDSLTEDITDLLNECIDETGFYTGMPYYGKSIDVLVAFTDQHTSSSTGIDYGKALSSLGAVIVVEEYHLLSGVQYTDNILQHELTHLYKLEEDWVCPRMPGYNCVMNYWPVYIPFPEDMVRPYGMTTESWCSNCSTTINSNKAKWGRLYEEHTGGSPGFLVPEGGFKFEQ